MSLQEISRKHKRANSFPGSLPFIEKHSKMITHRAADDGAAGIVIEPLPSKEFPKLKRGEELIPEKKEEDSVTSRSDDNELSIDDDEKNTSKRKRKNSKSKPQYIPEPFKRKVIRRTLFAICVLIGNSVLSAYLKKYGIIDKDLHELAADRIAPVAETIIPEFQQRFELFEMHMRDTLESARFYTPGFNETLYWLRMNQTETEQVKTQAQNRPGYKLVQETGAHGQYPVVMVPGFVTSGLEVWRGKDCMGKLFRERVWGGFSSAQYWLRERYCVMENLALDPVHGGDPENIKLRSSQGFQAADFFVGSDWMYGNYWVWSKIFENLADVGYDAASMSMEAYDWRLAFSVLQERDGYFTHLKSKIESYKKTTGKKIIITSHSMGALVVNFFFAWVTEAEKKGGGGGGKKWVDQHIHAYVNIAGSNLGVVKATSALMSGEMSDTVFLGGVGDLVERFIPRKARKDLWSSWGSLWSMLPKGGDGIWNIGADLVNKPTNHSDTISDQEKEDEEEPSKVEYADDLNTVLFALSNTSDEEAQHQEYEPICKKDSLIDPSKEYVVNDALFAFASQENHTVQETIDFLLKWGGGLGPDTASAKHHSFNYKKPEKPSPRTWHDFAQTPLPYAPNMKIYCLYGVGIDTERAYVYKKNPGEKGTFMEDNSSDDNGTPHVADPPFILDTSVEDPENQVLHGVKYGDGDGSVPLMCLGYMCEGPWKDKKSGFNPSGIKVITREYLHQPEFTVDDPMRSGPHSAEHVDILGNVEMMEDLMRIVTDHKIDEMEDRIVSDIRGIVQRVKDHPKGGLPKPRRR